MAIRDGRPLVALRELSLDRSGFTQIAHRSVLADFSQDATIRDIYYRESEALLRDVTGAEKIVVFDHTLRDSAQGSRRTSELREPVRRGLQAAGASARAAAAAGPAPDLSHVFRNKRAFLPLLLAPGITAMITFGVTAWLPATFIRQWGWTPGEIGPAYGVIILTFGIGGMLLSGFLADYLTARGKQVGSIVISLVATGVLIASGLVLAFAPSPTVALVAVAVTTFFLGMPVALAPPILQAVTPNQLRGQVTSIYLLLINLIGLGLGPFLVAFFTDFVFHDEKLVGLSLGCLLYTSPSPRDS